MTEISSRPRRHSLSNDGGVNLQPQLAKFTDMSRKAGPRRVGIPRSKSTSNMLDAVKAPLGVTEHEMRAMAREQIDRDNLRELVEFFRTTAPPSDSNTSSYEDCLMLPGGGENKKWSIKSLRKGRRARSQSAQITLPDSAVAETSIAGHRYIAISIPIQHSQDGPWFRSQYPVYNPVTPSGQAVNGRSLNERSFSKATSERGRNRTRTSSGTSEADRCSAGTANRPSEADTPPPRQAPTVRTFTSESGLVTVLKPVDEVRQSKLPEVRLQAHPQSPTSAETRYPTSVTSSPKASLKVSPNKPADILVKRSLEVPRQNITPESPDFTNALAAMTFPSPPSSSRSSSPASCTRTASSASPARIRPRTSSKRACMSPASLDEIVMGPTRPGVQSLTSEVSQPTLHKSERSVTSCGTIESCVPMAAGTPKTAKASPKDSPETVKLVRSGSADSSKTATADTSAVVVAVAEKLELYRQSIASETTTTVTGSHRQSTNSDGTAASDSYRHSGISDTTMTTLNDDIITVDPPLDDPDSVDPLDTSRPLKPWMVSAGKHAGSERSESPDTVRTETPSNEDNSQPWIIADRRMARRMRVREKKQRDVEAARARLTVGVDTAAVRLTGASYRPWGFDAMDSPVLGWFPNETLRRLSAQSLSMLNPASRKSSLHTSAETFGPASQSSYLQISVEAKPPLSGAGQRRASLPTVANAMMPFAQASRRASVQTVAELIPETVPKIAVANMLPSAQVSSNMWTVSPIMVVADVEPRPGSPHLRLGSSRSSTPNSTSSPRPVSVSLGPKLKVNTQTRPRPPPIKIAKTPPKDEVFCSTSHAHTPSNMPTPPLSPAPQLSPSSSLPPRAISPTTKPITPWDRTSLSRRRDWHVTCRDEREQDYKRRSAIIRERLMREKLEKDREISELVAQTVEMPQYQDNGENESLVYETLRARHTQDIERRLQRLEKNGDAWLSVMAPLLENMNQTLEGLHCDTGLTMGDFEIDMEAESRRLSYYSQPTPMGESKRQSLCRSLEYEDRPHSMPISSLVREKPRRRRFHSTSQLVKLRLNVDQPVNKFEAVPEVKEAETVGVAAPPPPPSPPQECGHEATPQQGQEQADHLQSPSSAEPAGVAMELEFEAQMAIRRRMQEQEAMMDELLSRMGLPSPRPSVSGPSTNGPPEASGEASGSCQGQTPARANDTIKDAEKGGNPRDSGGMGNLNPLMQEIRSASVFELEDEASNSSGGEGGEKENSIRHRKAVPSMGWLPFC